MRSVEQIFQRLEALKSDRSNWDGYFQELADYFLPRKARFTEQRQSGEEIDTELYDSTGVESALICAAGLNGYLTNPSTRWFALKLEGQEIGQRGAEWLKECEDIIFDTLAGSNFYQQIHEGYLDLTTFGTMCMYEEADPKDKVRFYTRHLSEIFFTEDNRGRLDSVFRIFELTAAQARMQFGDNVSSKIRELSENKPEEKVKFLHVVYPRENYDPRKRDKLNMPIASLWIEYETKKVVQEGGYMEMPFFVVRFLKFAGERYGFSPAMAALPDMRMLNEMAKDVIMHAQKQVNPPLDAPEEGYSLPLDMSPGAINYRRPGLGKEEAIRPLLPAQNIGIGYDLILRVEEKIKRQFYTDLFLVLAQRKNMTATEVVQRVNEKMLLLAPTLGRLISELLDPLIIRTFNLLMRGGHLPPPPPELQGASYTIEYTSPLAKAQKASESNSVNTFTMLLAELAQLNPSVLDNVNFDKLIREYAEMQNISAALLKDPAEVEIEREERKQAQIMAMAAQQGGTNG